MRPARISFALTIAALACAILAQSASASRPFDWAVLHKGEDPNRLRLVVRTTTGIEKPERIQLRFGGEELFGATYFSTSVTKDGEPFELIDDTRLKVDFDHERGNRDIVRWSSGCNFFGTGFVIHDERLITENNSGSTEVGCRERAYRQDQFFARFFERNPALVTSGNGVQLSNDRVVIELQRKR